MKFIYGIILQNTDQVVNTTIIYTSIYIYIHTHIKDTKTIGII